MHEHHYERKMENYWEDNKSGLLRRFSTGSIIILPSSKPSWRCVDSRDVSRKAEEVKRVYSRRHPLVKHVVEEQWASHRPARTEKKLHVTREMIRRSNALYGFIDGDSSILAYLNN